jgi:hypothetical protein
MDDMKRAIYMEALRLMKDEQERWSTGFVCLDLNRALQTVAGDRAWVHGVDKFDDVLEEFFPEFFAFFDGSAWTETGARIDKEDKHGAWWEKHWFEPRICILEFILNNR